MTTREKKPMVTTWGSWLKPCPPNSLHQTKGRESQELQRDALQAFARPNSGATTYRVDCNPERSLVAQPGTGTGTNIVSVLY
jgi:hypothetical protein